MHDDDHRKTVDTRTTPLANGSRGQDKERPTRPLSQQPDSQGQEELDSLPTDSQPATRPRPSMAAKTGGSGSTFVPNTILANRFRIVRLLGKGGMGEVYEAEDLELHERVAVKMVLPWIGSSEDTMARFRREIHLARKVTHPNVCRIYDIFHHSDPESDRRVTFLTMELLSGETLAARIKRRGPIPTNEALPIIRQIVKALAAAHRVKVIHRDLKASNVILLPGEEGGEVRAVVTDFGIARSSAVDTEEAAALTVAGMVMGSPAYMAPEQVRGDVTSPASDIYALGVVMYEMVTGKLPFSGASPLSMAVARLEETPAPLRTHIPDLNPLWEATILRCLEREPDDRFARISDVIDMLSGKEVGGKPKQVDRRGRRLALAAAVVIPVLLILAAVLWWKLRPPAELRTGGGPRPVVAVLGFNNLTGQADLAWLSTALPVLLTTELGVGETIRLIPGENVSRARTDLELGETYDSLAPDTLHKVRELLGTDYVVLGSFMAQGGTAELRLDLRLQDARAGETVAAPRVMGQAAGISELVAAAAAELRRSLGSRELSAAERRAADALLPATSEAARLYTEGLAQLHLFDAVAARDLLQRAVEADPDNALAHVALAQAWRNLGYDARATKVAEHAIDLSRDLPRTDQLAIEARYHDVANQWEMAIEKYRALWAFFPDDLELGLRLVEVQRSAGKAQEALDSITRLRTLPPPAGNDPRIDLGEAEVANLQGDFRRQLELSSLARDAAEDLGARLVAARASYMAANALGRLGEFDRANATADRAREDFIAAGDLKGAAEALSIKEIIARQRGDLAMAEQLTTEILAEFRKIGFSKGVAHRLLALGSLKSRKSDFAGARSCFTQAIEIYRSIDDAAQQASALNNLANVLREEGKLSEALENYSRGLAIVRQHGDRNREAAFLSNMAGIDYRRGQLPQAAESYRQALAIFEETGDRSNKAFALVSLGKVLLEQDELTAAEHHLQEAVVIREELEQGVYVAYTRVHLALAAIETARYAEAESLARAQAAGFEAAGMSEYAGLALAVTADALLYQGKINEARQAINDARKLTQDSREPEVTEPVAIVTARIVAAIGRAHEAAEELQRLVADAGSAVNVPTELAALLTLGQTELQLDDPAIGRSRLKTLAHDARERGFLRIARRAEDALANAGPD